MTTTALVRLTRAIGVALALTACAPRADETAAGDLLYVWAGDADTAHPDFLAVIDARAGSESYGHVLGTVPVEGRGNEPHHTEYELTAGTLFANGWVSGRTFIFDLADPLQPRVAATFGARGGYAWPHSYARLPNGHLLTTFQSTEGRYAPPGALVELDSAGTFVRATSGASPDVPTAQTWTYSLLVLPDLDRVVTTNTRMGLPAPAVPDPAHQHVEEGPQPTHIQVWKLSDLSLVATLRLPPQDGGHEVATAEPRRLANGEVYVNTFTCGLYHLVGVGGAQPAVEPTLAARFAAPGWCAVPVVVGNYWIQPTATENAIVAYDLSDPAHPREASRLALDSAHAGVHWLALDPTGRRIVVTASAPGAWVMIVDVDPATGLLSVDERFRDAGATRAGLNFDRGAWPHGETGRADPHGAVFGPARR